MSEGNTEIEGATAAPVEGVRVKDAGEFAAYWNGLTPEGREAFVGYLREASDGWLKCFQEDHKRQLEQIRRLHEVATERTVQLAAVIEEALALLPTQPWRTHDIGDAYMVDNVDEARAMLRTADTSSALREVRAEEWDEGWDTCANWWGINHHGRVRDKSNPHREEVA